MNELENKMLASEKLCTELLDCLMAVAISANGGADIIDELDEDEIANLEEYSRAKFNEIMGEWENVTGTEWAIVPDKVVDEVKQSRIVIPDLACQVDD